MRRAWKAIVRQFKTLELLPEYFLSVKAEAWDLAWGPGLIAIVFCLWWYQRTTPMPSLNIALFLGAALVLAGYYLWRADHILLVPKITLRFEDRTPFVQMTAVKDPEVTMRKYFRVFPDCSTAVESQGYLLAVFREVKGHWQPTLFDEPVSLTWADGRTGPIKIEPEIGPYLNVFYVETYEKQIVPCLAQPTLRTSAVFLERLEQPRATFRFDIKVTNGNRISLRVTMDERLSYWDRPLIEVLPDDGKSSN